MRRARLLRVEDGPPDMHGEPSWRFFYRNNLGDPNGETEVDQIVGALTKDDALRCLVGTLRMLGIQLDTGGDADAHVDS